MNPKLEGVGHGGRFGRPSRTLLNVNSIEIVVDAAEAEEAGGLMWASGVAGIEERDESDGRVRLIAGVPEEATSAVVEALDRWTVEVEPMDPDRWADSWRPYAKAARISGGIVVQPPWIEPIARPGELEVVLDPGRAWGHGAHPSTLLAAEDLVAAGDLAGRSVLDVGCGSGLLSVLAALRGADAVVAIDIEAAAVEATLANALVNDVADSIDVSTTPVQVLDVRFDVVVANIGLGVLVDLAAPLADRLGPDGRLILSGLLVEQVDAARCAYPDLREMSRRELDGWGSLVLAAP